MLKFSLPCIKQRSAPFVLTASLILVSLLVCDARGQIDIEAAKKKESEAIKNAVAQYVAAFNARDSKKMASHWSEKGIYASRSTGKLVAGRANLEKEFASMFKTVPNLKLVVTTDEIEFLSPSVAIERGTATVTQKGSDAVEKSEYSTVFVKKPESGSR